MVALIIKCNFVDNNSDLTVYNEVVPKYLVIWSSQSL